MTGQTNLPTTGESNFALMQREAKAIQASSMIPKSFKDNFADCMIALQISKNIGVDPFTVMQNLYQVHGKMTWSSQFIISALNSCGRFSPLRYKMTGEGDSLSCTAWALDKIDGERLEGPAVTMKMAKDEGWLNKVGSKWKTMPDLMIRYRAAAFFGRLYAPDIFNGMHMIDEIEDVQSVQDIKDVTPPKEKGTSPDDVLAKLEQKKEEPTKEPATEEERLNF